LKEAIFVIEVLGTNSSRTSVNGSRPQRIVSAASRRRNGAGSKGQMAKDGKKPQPALNTIGAPKRTMSSELLKPFETRQMRSYPVSGRINHVTNDDEECSRPVALTEEQPGLFAN